MGVIKWLVVYSSLYSRRPKETSQPSARLLTLLCLRVSVLGIAWKWDRKSWLCPPSCTRCLWSSALLSCSMYQMSFIFIVEQDFGSGGSTFRLSLSLLPDDWPSCAVSMHLGLSWACAQVRSCRAHGHSWWSPEGLRRPVRGLHRFIFLQQYMGHPVSPHLYQHLFSVGFSSRHPSGLQ